MLSTLAGFVKKKRKAIEISQAELALQSGLGLRFIHELEDGKPTLRMDKANQLPVFRGYRLGPCTKGDCGMKRQASIVRGRAERLGWAV